LICKGFKKVLVAKIWSQCLVSELQWGTVVQYDSVLNKFLNEANNEGQPSCCAQLNACCALRQQNQRCL